MNVDATLEAGAQLAEGGPGRHAFKHPAMAPKALIALDALACNLILDAPALEVRVASGAVISLVRMQPAGPASGPA